MLHHDLCEIEMYEMVTIVCRLDMGPPESAHPVPAMTTAFSMHIQIAFDGTQNAAGTAYSLLPAQHIHNSQCIAAI